MDKARADHAARWSVGVGGHAPAGAGADDGCGAGAAETAAPPARAATKPSGGGLGQEDDAQWFSLGMLLAVLMGPKHFGGEGDPEHAFRKPLLRQLLKAGHIEETYDTAFAVICGEVVKHSLLNRLFLRLARRGRSVSMLKCGVWLTCWLLAVAGRSVVNIIR